MSINLDHSANTISSFGVLGVIDETAGAAIPSAATLNLEAASGNFVHVTGTTAVTAITLASGAERTVVFDGALTLTYNAVSLILPGSANITTAPGDVMKVRGDGAGNVRVVSYTPAAIVPGAVGSTGLPDFTDTLNTAAPNATVPAAALAVTNAATNADAAIVPKGNGAFILGPVPDSTVTGGNKRGQYAVDLQIARLNAAHVASGTFSFASGWDNTSSSNYSTAMGAQCVASGQNSVSIGTSNTASAISAVAIGMNNTVGAGYSSAIGFGHTLSSGSYAFAAGYTNVASGTGAVALGGSHNASGAYGVALGRFALATGYGKVALGSYSSSTAGQAQRAFMTLRGVTTNATPKLITADGNSAATANQLTLQASSAMRVRVFAVAVDFTNRTDAKEWTGDMLVVRGTTAASTTIVNSSLTSTFATSAAASWALSLTVDTTNGSIATTVTGSTTDQIDWSISFDVIEVC